MSLLGIRESVGKAVPWRFTCVLMQQNTFENKIHTCYEIKQLNVKTCFQSVTGSKTRVSVFKQNTLHTCFVKTQVFKIKTPTFCQNTSTCFQSVTRRCFLTCLDSKHPLLQCKTLIMVLLSSII